MSALDDPDAAWYHPTFMGFGRKLGEDTMTARDTWAVAVNAGSLRPGHSAFQIARRPHGATQLHYVNAIDPGTAGSWLLPDVVLDNVVPARLPI